MTINDSIRAKYYGGCLSSVQFIVLHYTANSGDKATAKGNANYFANCDRTASAHYVVDEGDIIYNCVPENRIAYAVGGNIYPATLGAGFYGICTNANSISIEMVSHSDSNGYYIPQKTVDNAFELVEYLQSKYNVPNEHIIRHYDVNGKPCPWCWTPVQGYTDSEWKKFKNRLNNEAEPVNIVSNIFMIRIKCDELNIRKDAGVEYQKTGVIKDNHKYTVIATKKSSDGGTWGQLKSGIGWINISDSLVERIGNTTTNNKAVTDALVIAVIRGEYGNGAIRRTRLEEEGYNYDEVTKAVNRRLGK